MQAVNVVLMGGHIHDSTVAIDLLEGIDLADKKILAEPTVAIKFVPTLKGTAQ